ncbi:MAG: alpha/beta fold hydrolase [Holophagales bacterium]|nr:alpha/beta fold hydrolase [Holophagales bacterium]
MQRNLSVRYVSAAFVAAILVLVIGGIPASASEKLMDVEGYPTLVRKPVELWSDGTRLAGDVFYPKATAEGEKLPAIVLCHGWGGTKAHLNRGIAPRFAAAGYLVLAFDYRGWGESDSRLVVRGEMPEPDKDGYVTVRAQAIRQLVDPLDQQEDIDAAISFVEGEPHADASRIGIWGSSFGGGHVIWRAAHDRRVTAVAAQVGAMDQRAGLVAAPGGLKGFHRTAIQRARGEVEPVPVGADQPEGLTGSPYYERFAKFSPVEDAHLITAPTIIIDAKQEHYFDIREHGERVYKILSGRVPVEYHAWDITHYAIYSGEWLDKAMDAEIDFFDRHLK